MNLPVRGIVRELARVAGACVSCCDRVLREIELHELVHISQDDHIRIHQDDAL